MRTVHLGQFTEEHAEAIAARLEAAGITWWAKQHSALVGWLSASDWGARLFVDADRLDEARSLAREVLGDDERPDA
jgi:hypothetical protein